MNNDEKEGKDEDKKMQQSRHAMTVLTLYSTLSNVPANPWTVHAVATVKLVLPNLSKSSRNTALITIRWYNADNLKHVCTYYSAHQVFVYQVDCLSVCLSVWLSAS